MRTKHRLAGAMFEPWAIQRVIPAGTPLRVHQVLKALQPS